MEIRKDNTTPEWVKRWHENRMTDGPESPSWERMREHLERAEQLGKRKNRTIVLSLVAAAACIAGGLLLLPLIPEEKGSGINDMTGESISWRIPASSKTDTVLRVDNASMIKTVVPLAKGHVTPDTAKLKMVQQDLLVQKSMTIPNDSIADEQAVMQAPQEVNAKPTIIPLNVFKKQLAGVFNNEKSTDDSISNKPYLRKYKVKSVTAPEHGRVFSNDHPIPAPFN